MRAGRMRGASPPGGRSCAGDVPAGRRRCGGWQRALDGWLEASVRHRGADAGGWRQFVSIRSHSRLPTRAQCILADSSQPITLTLGMRGTLRAQPR